MDQNRSAAVMAKRTDRHVSSLDFFPTPPWATRALCEWLGTRITLNLLTCWEPACGNGVMVKPLAEYFQRVYASDIFDYECGYQQYDFLSHSTKEKIAYDWIITNPPFQRGEEFAIQSTIIAKQGTAILVRTAFLESIRRYENLFVSNPPTDILQFSERVTMVAGRLERNKISATAYCWLVWDNNSEFECCFHWIAPCRKRLERDSDYSKE